MIECLRAAGISCIERSVHVRLVFNHASLKETDREKKRETKMRSEDNHHHHHQALHSVWSFWDIRIGWDLGISD